MERREMTVRRARILCLADAYPWPARDGYRIRLDQIIRALAEAGSVDLLAVPRGPADFASPPAEVPLARCQVIVGPQRRVTARLLGRTLRGPLPRRVLWRDWSDARRELGRSFATPYDLAWYSHADTLAGIGAVPAKASVLDLDNLEHMRLRSLRAAHLRRLGALLGHPHRAGELEHEVRNRLTGAVATFDAGRWERLQRRLAPAVDRTVVCSELDRRRLNVENAVVIPNGYDAPTGPVNGPGHANVMSMVGLFHYGPNLDAARFFVEEVLPRVRAELPDATVRFIGRHDGRLGDLEGVEGVEATGEVESVPAELARARVAIVPIRAGSGTRLKILEAFACKVPVVSTSLGCEGLEVTPNRHLLVADSPAAFAKACIRLLTDAPLHDRVTREAWSLFESRYRWDDIRRQIRAIVSSLTDAAGPLDA
jgi:glycosyltransferase involved in cell wall biosynthesis